MTTIPAAAQRLIEAALAWMDDVEDPSDYAAADDELARRVADLYALDPTGSELARLAEIGAAVERLPEHCRVEREGDHWRVFLYSGSPGMDPGYVTAMSRSTLPAAIAAALGDES